MIRDRAYYGKICQAGSHLVSATMLASGAGNVGYGASGVDDQGELLGWCTDQKLRCVVPTQERQIRSDRNQRSTEERKCGSGQAQKKRLHPLVRRSS